MSGVLKDEQAGSGLQKHEVPRRRPAVYNLCFEPHPNSCHLRNARLADSSFEASGHSNAQGVSRMAAACDAMCRAPFFDPLDGLFDGQLHA